jgi:hypothetical protein
MNATLGFPARDFQYDQYSSDSQHQKFNFGGGVLTIVPDLDAQHDSTRLRCNLIQNESPKNSFGIVVSSISYIPSKHAPVFDFWIQPQSMQSIL